MADKEGNKIKGYNKDNTWRSDILLRVKTFSGGLIV